MDIPRIIPWSRLSCVEKNPTSHVDMTALTHDNDGMIRINVNGHDVFVSNPAEAAALLRELANVEAPKVGRPKLNLPPKNGAEGMNSALTFLTTVTAAGTSGADSEHVMKALDTDEPKGVGGRLVKVNNLLLRLGFSPDEVYKKVRTPDGKRWKQGPKIVQAMGAIKQEQG
jgi:hypothetical protein